MMHMGRYHEYIGGCSVHRGFQYKSCFYHFAPPHESLYPPDVLMVSLRCTKQPLMYS